MSTLVTPPLAVVPMTVQPAATASQPAATTVHLPLYRLSVEQYDRMVEYGVLTTEDKVELLEGFLVAKMSIHPPHSTTLGIVSKKIVRLVPEAWTWRLQQPIKLATSEPVPDFAVVRGSDLDYVTSHPSPADAALVIEVSDSSVDIDRGYKRPMYAIARVPIFWIVNIPDQTVEVYEYPSGPSPTPGYGVANVYRSGDAVPVVIGGTSVGSVAVNDLFP